MVVAAAALLIVAGAAAALAMRSDPEPGEPTGVPGREAPQAAAPSLRLETVAADLVRPTTVVAAPGDADALWVTEQTGRVVRLDAAGRRTVLDLSDSVSVGAERGLLGLAFHPDFSRNRRFFVDYTDTEGDTRVVEYHVGDGPGDGRELLHVEQPEENHNGGMLLFAPDGRLMVGMGDGGGAFDPGDRAQDPGEKLGKLLAADVDAAGDPRWQIILTGLRNPWRIWVDPALNELWIGDVGQDSTEEVDRVAYEPDEPPKNLGWPAWEGDRPLGADRLADGAEPVAPVAVYGHDEGCSITGGLVYRGRDLSALRGRYVYGDFCSGNLWSLRPEPALAVRDIRRERTRIPQLTSIAADGHGELVFTTGDGKLLRAVKP
jgi:glucose/arabinose dehydrogenase